jgi:hypothetical protein
VRGGGKKGRGQISLLHQVFNLVCLRFT